MSANIIYKESGMSYYFRRVIFWFYLFSLLLISVLPLNSVSSDALVNVFIVNIRLDYLLHSILFIPWFFISLLTFRAEKISDKLMMAGSGLLMAFITEGIQYFLAYRTYNINDLLSNFLGVLLGSFILFTNIPRKMKGITKIL